MRDENKVYLEHLQKDFDSNGQTSELEATFTPPVSSTPLNARRPIRGARDPFENQAYTRPASRSNKPKKKFKPDKASLLDVMPEAHLPCLTLKFSLILALRVLQEQWTQRISIQIAHSQGCIRQSHMPEAPSVQVPDLQRQRRQGSHHQILPNEADHHTRGHRER